MKNYEPDNQEEGFFLTGGHSSSSEGCLINFFNEYGSHTRVTKKIKDEYEFNKENITEVQNMIYYVISQKELKGIKREYKSEYDYKPEINDIIRFGRVQFIVRSMKDKSTEENNNENNKRYKFSRFRKRIRCSKRTRKKRKNFPYSINSSFCCMGFPYYYGNER